MLIQDFDGRFSIQLYTLSEMGFNNRQANIEGKLSALVYLVKLSCKSFSAEASGVLDEIVFT